MLAGSDFGCQQYSRRQFAFYLMNFSSGDDFLRYGVAEEFELQF